MPLAKETIYGYGQLSGTGQNALTIAPGQTTTVRNFSTGSAYLQEVTGWDTVGAYTMEIKSPKMHDTTYGIQAAASPLSVAGTVIFNPQQLLPSYTTQQLFSTDNLTWSMAGANSDYVAGTLDVYYTDLSGIASRLYSWQAIEPLIVNLAGVIVSPETSGTELNFGTSALLNSDLYNLKANTDYAILGWTSAIPLAFVGFRGTDTGNLWVGGSGSVLSVDSGAYFVDQSIKYGPSGRPAQIPVFNSNNAPGLEVNIAGVATSTHYNVSLRVAQLSQLLPSPGAGV